MRLRDLDINYLAIVDLIAGYAANNLKREVIVEKQNVYRFYIQWIYIIVCKKD